MRPLCEQMKIVFALEKKTLAVCRNLEPFDSGTMLADEVDISGDEEDHVEKDLVEKSAECYDHVVEAVLGHAGNLRGLEKLQEKDSPC